MSDTLYNMICVLDNLGSQLSAVSNNFFKTNPLPPASTISITFKEQNQ